MQQHALRNLIFIPDLRVQHHMNTFQVLTATDWNLPSNHDQ
jgi:hypothetical protein